MGNPIATTIAPLPASHFELRKALAYIGLALAGYAVLWAEFTGMDLKIPNYLILHTVMEMAAIVVAMLVAGVVWNAYAPERPGNLVLIGAVLFGTGLLDFAHMLSVPGMPTIVTPADVQKSITFWLAARALPALGLLTIAMRAWTPLQHAQTRYWMAAGVTVYVALVCWVALFHMDSVPVFFVALQGLTAYKVWAEYLLVAAYTLAALLFLQQLRQQYRERLADLFVACAIAAISELCFTLYRSHGDLFNLVGHLYKITCYFFIYRAVFVWSVRQPFEALHELNQQLDQRVQERTADLQRTMEDLRQAQSRLVQSEKIASLGSIVTAIAHELNTPIGNCMTVASTLEDKARNFHALLESGAMRRSQLDAFANDARTGMQMLQDGLRRADSLVQNFKQVAVEQSISQRRSFRLRDVLQEAAGPAQTSLRSTPYRLELDIPDTIFMDSFAGPIEQIVTQLISNAVLHGFRQRPEGRMWLRAHAQQSTVQLVFGDDGVGMDEEVRTRVFDPFFTTHLGQGSNGLGMNICYNLVTGPLGGSIVVESSPGKGCTYTLSLPLISPR